VGTGSFAGAASLAERLLTFPTHSMLTGDDRTSLLEQASTYR
jgi:hypothetical protein